MWMHTTNLLLARGPPDLDFSRVFSRLLLIPSRLIYLRSVGRPLMISASRLDARTDGRTDGRGRRQGEWVSPWEGRREVQCEHCVQPQGEKMNETNRARAKLRLGPRAE